MRNEKPLSSHACSHTLRGAWHQTTVPTQKVLVKLPNPTLTLDHIYSLIGRLPAFAEIAVFISTWICPSVKLDMR